MYRDTIRESLKSNIGYDDGVAVRRILNDYARAHYRPKHSDKYLQFMNDNLCTFTENGAQSTNHPYFLTLFTVASQHVTGDCAEECLDKAIERADALRIAGSEK